MKKALAAMLSAVMITGVTVALNKNVALAEETPSIGGNFESIYKVTGHNDPTFSNTLTLDLKGNLAKVVEFDGKLLFKKNYILDDLHFVKVPNVGEVTFDYFKFSNSGNIGPVKYDAYFTRGLHVLPSTDPMTVIYEKGATTDVVELKAKYQKVTMRYGMLYGNAGRWFAEARGNVTKELLVGGLLNTEYLPGVRENNKDKPVFNSYTNSLYATYKPSQIKGLEATVAYYATKAPGPNAKKKGPLEAGGNISLSASQLSAYGLNSVLGKGYTFVIRGRFNDEFYINGGKDTGWTPGNGKWKDLQADDIKCIEKSDGLYIPFDPIIERAKKNKQENNISYDRAADGGVRFLVFDQSGTWVADTKDNIQLSSFVGDPEGEKVTGNAVIAQVRYKKDKLDSTIDYKQLSDKFDATSTNFYEGKKDPVVFDEVRKEFFVPYTYNKQYRTAIISNNFTKIAAYNSYELNDYLTLNLDLLKKDVKDWTDNGKNTKKADLSYTMVRPKVEFTGFNEMLDVEGLAEFETIKTKYVNGADEKAKITGYSVVTEVKEPFKYIKSIKASYKDRQIGDNTGNAADKLSQDKNEIFLSTETPFVKDMRFFGSYKLESDNEDRDGKRSTLISGVDYNGVTNLELKLQNQYVYERKDISDVELPCNWVIGEAKYRIPQCEIETKLLAKYDTIEKNNTKNPSSLYLEAKKYFKTSTMTLSYGTDENFYDYDKNTEQTKLTKLEYLLRF